MPQADALNLLAVSILLGMSSHAVAAPTRTTAVAPPSQIAQTQSPQSQTPDQMEQDFENRLRNAQTPDERARVQAEHDRMMQQGAVPDSGTNVRSGAGAADVPGASGDDSGPSSQRGSGSPGDSSSGGGPSGGGSGGR